MTVKFSSLSFIISCLIVAILLFSHRVYADPPPVQKPSSEEDIKAALFGGVPGDQWTGMDCVLCGLMMEGLATSM